VRGNQRGADARIEAHLLVDGAGIALKGPGLPPFGLAEHHPDQPVEQVNRLIREAGGNVEADGDQRRVPALTFVVGNVLDRHAFRLANELSHAGLVDGMTTGRLDADAPHVLQTFDQAEYRGRLGRFRHLPQPSQVVLATAVAALRECVEATTLFSGQALGQPAMRLPARLMTKLSAEPLQALS
jgi:hypothetical protein